MVESGTATDNVLKYAHWFVLQHSIASDIESPFVDVRRWDQAARQDRDEGDLDESDEVRLGPLEDGGCAADVCGKGVQRERTDRVDKLCGR
jgi:hypothetical protein